MAYPLTRATIEEYYHAKRNGSIAEYNTALRKLHEVFIAESPVPRPGIETMTGSYILWLIEREERGED
jgi:hypothetical protein